MSLTCRSVGGLDHRFDIVLHRIPCYISYRLRSNGTTYQIQTCRRMSVHVLMLLLRTLRAMLRIVTHSLLAAKTAQGVRKCKKSRARKSGPQLDPTLVPISILHYGNVGTCTGKYRSILVLVWQGVLIFAESRLKSHCQRVGVRVKS